MASGAEWLLNQIGDVLSATTTVDVGASWFRTHYGQMTALAGVVILPMLLASTLQAVVRQNPGQLIRTYLVQLPLALLLAVVAIQIVILSLSATDAMSDAVAGGTNADVSSLLTTVTSGLVSSAADPSIASFVLLLVALLIAVAAFVLWLELLIRAAAVYVAVLFLPLALATLVWPAVSHWCRRLVETLAALILSKFVIVATLSLAAGAVASGTAGSGSHGSGFSSVLAGGALLLMATFVPFAILRMIPAVEAGAVAHLDGLRERGTAAMTRMPRIGGVPCAARGVGGAGGLTADGRDGGGRRAGGGWGRGREAMRAMVETGSGTGIPTAPGDPSAQRIYDEGVAMGIRPRPKGPKPLLPAPTLRSADARRRIGFGRGRGADRRLRGAARGGAGGAAGPTGFEPDPADRVGARSAKGRKLGPATTEDIWMWEGVPPGHSLMTRYEPGERRYYMGDNEGPSLKKLPPAWPPGQGPDAVSDEAGSRYRFGPRERGGALAGWRAGQIMTVAVGLVFGVIVLRLEPNALGVAAAVGILVLYGALATVPVAGRTGDEWLPVVVCWAARRTGIRGARRIGPLRGMRLLHADWRDMGVVHDRAGRTLTAALAAARRKLRAVGCRRAGPPGGRVGLGARLVGPRGLGGAPGAMGGGGVPR